MKPGVYPISAVTTSGNLFISHKDTMLTEDYLIKMINLALAALLRIVGLRKAGDYTEALLLIDMTFEQLLGLRASMVKSLDDDHLYYLLSNNDVLDARRLALIASLFHEEGDIYAAQHRTQESQADYTRALRYFLEVSFSADAPFLEDLQGRIDDLIQKLDVPNLGSETLWPLASYYEQNGAYIQAEALLLNMVERDAIRLQILPELVAFYQRLLEKTPDALSAGGLSQAQVQARLTHWQQMSGAGQ